MADQCVPLRFLKIVAPIERVKPYVKEEIRPVTAPHDEALLAQSLFILCKDKIDLVAFKVGECVDNAVRRNHGFVFQHERLELLCIHYMACEREGGIHNDGVRRESPEVGGVAVKGLRVAEGRDEGPGFGRVADVVVFCAGVEGLVA